MEITIGLALIAGFVSFISPCVLPLVPAYIGYMGGRMSSAALSTQGPNRPSLSHRLNVVVNGVFFVAGFTLVFVTIGLLSTAFVQQIGSANIRLATEIIGRLGGILIVFFGLHFMGALSSIFRRLRAYAHYPLTLPALMIVVSILLLWGFNGDVIFWNSVVWASLPLVTGVSIVLTATLWLWYVVGLVTRKSETLLSSLLNRLETALHSDTRQIINRQPRGHYRDSLMMGVVFSAGWTPCVGPVYGAVLTMAANGGDVGRAGVLLMTYSVGLGIPFLLTALMLDGAQVWLRRLKQHMRVVEVSSGALLIIVGLAVATGQLQRVSQQFAGDFAEFSIAMEEQAISLVTGMDVSSLESDSLSDAAPLSSADTIGLEIGNIAPDFETVTADGQAISLSSLRGSVVLLNFWATWCGPCRIEMPGFERQYRRYADRGFAIVAVNNAESVDTVAAFRDQFGLTFPMALDSSGNIQRQFGIISYPSTLLIDREGRIVLRHFGVVPPSEINRMLTDAGLQVD